MMKLFYTTEEVCTHLQIPKTTLEYYLLEFKIKIKKAGKNRVFSHKDIEKLQTIVTLKEKDGYTLEGVKEKLKQKKTADLSRQEIISKLKDIKKTLEIIRNGMD